MGEMKPASAAPRHSSACYCGEWQILEQIRIVLVAGRERPAFDGFKNFQFRAATVPTQC
jgi:hypothetical protein